MREDTKIQVRQIGQTRIGQTRIGQTLAVAIAAVLFGSTMILSAVGPARASDTVLATSHTAPATARYLA